MSSFADTLNSLSSAEEFFTFLAVPFDEEVVRVNRLHILKRWHDYLSRETLDGLDEAGVKAVHSACLGRAHADFVGSDAVTEGVFKVFRQVKGQAFVGLADLEPPPRG